VSIIFISKKRSRETVRQKSVIPFSPENKYFCLFFLTPLSLSFVFDRKQIFSEVFLFFATLNRFKVVQQVSDVGLLGVVEEPEEVELVSDVGLLAVVEEHR
jgi:hypothetical protein